MKNFEQWNGFKGNRWKEKIDVRNFIGMNYTPYEGDASFLEGPTEATEKLWGKLQALQKEERAKGGVLDMETEVVTSLTAYGPGYIDEETKDLEKVVGLQTDKPLKRAFMPYGGIKMAEQACETYGYKVSDKIKDVFHNYEFKTHNQGVFDIYTPEMKIARHNKILTGLPDTYGRGRIVGDYRRVALYGIDALIEGKQKDFAACDRQGMRRYDFQLREEIADQIRALKGMKVMAEAYGYDILPDTTKQDGMEIHFQATVGADAKGTINAETYDPEAGNYSIFSWSEGNGIELATIENYLAIENRTDEYGVPAGSVKESFMEKLQTLKDQMKETTLLEETAEDEAEKILKDLNLENMQLLSSDKILWYAQSDYPEATILEQQEALWNADPNLGKTGYRLTYVPSVSGLKINQDKTGGYSDDSGFAYAPSMPVEQIYIVVTEDGIRSFKWKGMSQEEKVVTENVKLLAFDEIENRLIDQVKYLYPSSQPAESKTIFGYDVATVELGYTYIPAYKNPQNAWLVPAWFFTISESQDATAELGTAGRKIEGYQTDYIVLNATDGGRIGSYWR